MDFYLRIPQSGPGNSSPSQAPKTYESFESLSRSLCVWRKKEKDTKIHLHLPVLVLKILTVPSGVNIT